MKRPVQKLIPFEIMKCVKEDNGNLPNPINSRQQRKVAVTGQLRRRMNNLE